MPTCVGMSDVLLLYVIHFSFPYPVRPGESRDLVQAAVAHYKSSASSRQSGFMSSISLIFQQRFQLLIRRSRVKALSREGGHTRPAVHSYTCL